MMANRAKKTLNVGIVGAGRIAKEHLCVLVKRKDVVVCAIADVSACMADYTADRFGIEYRYSSCEDLLNKSCPDVVHVLTPPHTHEAVVHQCLEFGCHVIVEKPVALTRSSFQSMWALSEKQGCILTENQNYRFNGIIKDLQGVIAAGTIGKIREVAVRMSLGIREPQSRYADRNCPHPSHRLPAGVIHEFLTHLCYLALMIAEPYGKPNGVPEDVNAVWRNRNGPSDGDPFTVDDLDATAMLGPVMIRIRFDCTSKPDCFFMAVRGTNGSVSADLFQPNLEVVKPRGGPSQLSPIVNQYRNGKAMARSARRNFFAKMLGRTPYEGLREYLRQTYEAIANGRALPIGFDEIDQTMGLMETLISRRGSEPATNGDPEAKTK